MPRATPPVTVTPPQHGPYKYNARKDGLTHSSDYKVQYGSRKFSVAAKRVLQPAPRGKRRTEFKLVVEGYRYATRDGHFTRLVVELPPAVHAAVLEHFIAALGGTAPSKNAKRVTMRQVGGDDGYCWAVMVDGVPKWEGMQRGEATWRRNAEIARLDAGDAGPADVKSAEDVRRLQLNLRDSVLDCAISHDNAAQIVKNARAKLAQQGV